jgi:hypothetical protein
MNLPEFTATKSIYSSKTCYTSSTKENARLYTVMLASMRESIVSSGDLCASQCAQSCQTQVANHHACMQDCQARCQSAAQGAKKKNG